MSESPKGIHVVFDCAKALETLRAIPGACRASIRNATVESLKSGKTAARLAAREPYQVQARALTSAMHRSVIIGGPESSTIIGVLKASAKRMYLELVPHKSIFPYGAAFAELKPQFGLPVHLLHAFIPGAGRGLTKLPAYLRLGESRYPIVHPVGLAPSTMLFNTRTESKIQAAVQERMRKVLANNIQGFLKGALGVSKTGGIVNLVRQIQSGKYDDRR
jgi:hypothetical protein